MKFICQTLIILGLFTWQEVLDAQTTSLGLRSGLNIANADISGDGPNIDTDNRLGIDLAFLVDFGLNENFSVQPEVHFLQKGYKTSFGGEESRVALNYLEIPVLAKYVFGISESLSGFIMAGPGIGFGLEVRVKSDDGTETGSFNDAGLSGTDFTANFGGGISVSIPGGKVVLDIRYLLGLSNIVDEADNDQELKNRGVNIGLGFVTSFGQ